MQRATVLCLAAACFLLAGPAAHADPIPTGEFSWGYQFKPDGQTTNYIHSNGSLGVVQLPGTGGHSNILSASGVPVSISTPILEGSTAPPEHPQTVSNLPFVVSLKLTDNASNLSGFVSFTGTLSGTIWNGGSNLQTTLAPGASNTIDINHHLFKVTFDQFVTPTGGEAGKFVFDVKVSHNPEPSSLVLAGIGVPLFGVFLRRRKRKAMA